MTKQLGLACMHVFQKVELNSFKVPIPREFAGAEGPPKRFAAAVGQDIGSRQKQEDGFCYFEVPYKVGKEEKIGRLFAVLDGHSDRGEVSAIFPGFAKERLSELLQETAVEQGEELNDAAIGDAFVRLFAEFGDHYRELERHGGAVITSVFILDSAIYTVNVGDAVTFLFKSGKAEALPLSEPASFGPQEEPGHRFNRFYTQRGIKLAYDGSCVRLSERGLPKLNVSRDIGAFQSICCRPKITKIEWAGRDAKPGVPACAEGDFLCLVTDGMLEAALPEELAHEVAALLRAGLSLGEIACKLAVTAGSYPYNDNATIMLIPL
jgi:serine/threonine protein phosphatase PrpC